MEAAWLPALPHWGSIQSPFAGVPCGYRLAQLAWSLLPTPDRPLPEIPYPQRFPPLGTPRRGCRNSRSPTRKQKPSASLPSDPAPTPDSLCLRRGSLESSLSWTLSTVRKCFRPPDESPRQPRTPPRAPAASPDPIRSPRLRLPFPALAAPPTTRLSEGREQGPPQSAPNLRRLRFWNSSRIGCRSTSSSSGTPICGRVFEIVEMLETYVPAVSNSGSAGAAAWSRSSS